MVELKNKIKSKSFFFVHSFKVLLKTSTAETLSVLNYVNE